MLTCHQDRGSRDRVRDPDRSDRLGIPPIHEQPPREDQPIHRLSVYDRDLPHSTTSVFARKSTDRGSRIIHHDFLRSERRALCSQLPISLEHLVWVIVSGGVGIRRQSHRSPGVRAGSAGHLVLRQKQHTTMVHELVTFNLHAASPMGRPYLRLEVIVHSLTELLLYQAKGELAAEQAQPYWIWGIVATLAVCIMLVASLLYMRRYSYEVFLILHIVLAVFVLAGSWYHIEILFERKWGYEYFLYLACAVWFFDRVMRVLRIAKGGIRRAKVTEIGSAFVRVDVEGLRWSPQPGSHAYAYFPTIKPLTPWENHPFSVIPTAMLRSRKHEVSTGSDVISGSASSQDGDVEKSSGGIIAATRQIRATSPTLTAGVSLYIRKSKGRTGWLREQERLVALLDGPYTSQSTRQILKCDRLLLIAGGIGITGILPFAYAHLNVKLCWSVKDYAECLVKDLGAALAHVAEKEIRTGQRLDLQGLIAQEVDAASETSSKVKVGVVVCGPGGMCDDVRDMVARSGRQNKSNVVFELDVEAFSW